MLFIPRAEWGGGGHRATTAGFRPEDGGVTAHHEGTRGLQAQLLADHRHCYQVVRAIFDFHTRPVSRGGRGWADIAYTALACPHGYTFEGRWLGRRTAANGTDAGNDAWYAVCALVGEGEEPAAGLLAGMRTTVHHLWSKDARDRVNGHRDHKATECPGDALYAWVRAGMPEEDDMPTAEEIAKEVLGGAHVLNRVTGEPTSVAVLLSYAHKHAVDLRATLDDEGALAALIRALPSAAAVADAVVARLPAASPVDVDELAAKTAALLSESMAAAVGDLLAARLAE